MSLQLIYGRAGSGKSTFCLNEINERLSQAQEKALILLVPEQFSLQAEKNLARILNSAGTLHADVLTFRRMTYRVFNEIGGLAKPRISLSGKCMLIYKIMDELKDSLDYFSKAALQKGFVNTFLKTVTEFKRYGVTPEILSELNENLNEASILKSKLHDIASIFSEYNSFISRKYADSDDDLTLLADKLEAAHQFRGAEIWIDGFSGFTPQEYLVIAKLFKVASKINVTLCTDAVDLNNSKQESKNNSYTNVFMPLMTTAHKLKKIAMASGVLIEKPIHIENAKHDRFSESSELAHLERSYFSYPFQTFHGNTNDITVFTSLNIYSEVENTARDIISICKENGYRYRDIAVVARNLDTYEKLVGAIFTQYGIPFFLDKKKEINNHPLIQLVLSVQKIFTGNWSYEAVFSYLKTGMTGISREEIDLLENYVLAYGIKGKTWTQQESWDNEAIDSIRNKVIEPLLKYRSVAKGSKSVQVFCIALFDHLSYIEIPQRIEEITEHLRQISELETVNEMTQVWNAIVEVLDQAVEVAGTDLINIERFGELLEVGFAEHKTGLIPPSLDQVLVGSIERSKSHEIKALFIMGVNDSVFPAAATAEGILTDNDREIMLSLGVELAQDTSARIFDEQFLIYSALTTASKKLKISWSISDSEGKTLRPSIIISRLKKLFPALAEKSNITSQESFVNIIHAAAVPKPAFNSLVSAVRKKFEGSNLNDAWFYIYKWFKHEDFWSERLNQAFKGLSYSNKPDSITNNRISKLFGTPMYSSVSKMEKYASCPFSHFVQYGLRAEERRVLRVETPDIGTFMHEVLDRFSAILQESKLNWRDLELDWTSQTVTEIVDEMLGSKRYYAFRSSKRYIYLTLRLKKILKRAIWLIAEHFRRSSFDPVGYELEFSERGDFPAIEISVPSGESIKLIGRIDRLDAMKTNEGTYLRIIDYKSGNKALKLNEVYYGLKIQLLAYLDALSAVENSKLQKPIIPGGILYFRLDDPLVKGSKDMTEDEIERAVLKQLRMKGLLLADVNLIKAMDKGINGESLIIPARMNKGDELGRSSAVTLLQFEKLREHVRNLLTQMGQEIYNGNVEISPYKKKQISACTYCQYSSICQFDTFFKGNKYRNLDEIKDEEVWPLIEGGDSNE